MRKLLFLAVFAFVLSPLSVQAQGVAGNACQYVDYNYSYCASWMGRFANCRLYCDAIACNCLPGAYGGQCTRDSDGGYTWKTYNNIRFVDPSIPFELAYTVVSVRVTPPRANVAHSAVIRRRSSRA